MINSIKTAYRINVDKRGKITTGIKKKNDKGVEYPSTTDYFVIDEFPELKAIYGEKPKKLMLVFPQNEISSFLQIDKVLYGSNNAMIRKCDEIECIHRIDEELDHVGIIDVDGSLKETEPFKKKYVAGEISECCCKTMPSMITKNGKAFDIPFINSRCSLIIAGVVRIDYFEHGFKRLLEYPHLDLHEITQKWLSLDDLARILCLPLKSGNGLRAIQLWNEGRLEELKEYLKHDLWLTEQVYLRRKHLEGLK